MSEQSGKVVSRALFNFVHEVASAGQISALADRGYSVREICKRLDVPTAYEVVQNTVWRHLLDTGVVLLEEPEQGTGAGKMKQTRFIKEQNRFGKVSFRRLEEEISLPFDTYVKCEFGKQKYQDPEGFTRMLLGLEPRTRDYIEDLPWPLTPVWHAADGRMRLLTNTDAGTRTEK